MVRSCIALMLDSFAGLKIEAEKPKNFEIPEHLEALSDPQKPNALEKVPQNLDDSEEVSAIIFTSNIDSFNSPSTSPIFILDDYSLLAIFYRVPLKQLFYFDPIGLGLVCSRW